MYLFALTLQITMRNQFPESYTRKDRRYDSIGPYCPWNFKDTQKKFPEKFTNGSTIYVLFILQDNPARLGVYELIRRRFSITYPDITEDISVALMQGCFLTILTHNLRFHCLRENVSRQRVKVTVFGDTLWQSSCDDAPVTRVLLRDPESRAPSTRRAGVVTGDLRQSYVTR